MVEKESGFGYGGGGGIGLKRIKDDRTIGQENTLARGTRRQIEKRQRNHEGTRRKNEGLVKNGIRMTLTIRRVITP